MRHGSSILQLYPFISCKPFAVLFLHVPAFTSAQSYNNVTLGSSLSSFDKAPFWTSPSGEFSFGFYPQRDLFLLAIWFAKIPLNTIIWTGNQGKPVEKGSKIQLTPNGILSLKIRNGSEIWRVQAIDNSQVAYAAMLDTGNFVLTSIQSANVWESFSVATDTILPTQILEPGSILSSRLSEKEYTIGRFQFSVQDDGNLVLNSMARPSNDKYTAYWYSNTWKEGLQLVFNQSGSIYLTLSSGNRSYLSSERPVSTSEYYQRATLDFDGVFRQYIYPRTAPENTSWPLSWSTSWSLPQDICAAEFGDLGSGACGFNSYCRLDIDLKPECLCPPGYSYVDPNNIFGGCKQSFLPQTCGVTDGFEIQQIPKVNWESANYEFIKSVSLNWCSETCLNDCSCAASVFVNSSICLFKKFPLSNGRMSPSLDATALLKIGSSSANSAPPPMFTGEYRNHRKWVVAMSVVSGISVASIIVLLSLLLYIVCCKKQIGAQKEAHTYDVNLQSFTYRELEDATDGFSQELGKGASSTVYQGVLQSGSGDIVAVKKLDRIVEGNDGEFKAEVIAIGKTNHKNLARLLGICDEDAHRLLVYEFMRNGSLDKFLFGNATLGWKQRIQVIFGIASGLAYLHEDCSSQIIHCDVKPQNILLDALYVAKISDFGLAKLLKNDQTRTTTGVRGTRGYVAPEWFWNMPITAKVDVYSFGIVLLEIVCSKKNAQVKVGEEDIEILSDIVYDCCIHKQLHLVVPDDEEAKGDIQTLERFVMVALWCIQVEPTLRPSMKRVVQMLEGVVAVSLPQDPSSFMSQWCLPICLGSFVNFT